MAGTLGFLALLDAGGFGLFTSNGTTTTTVIKFGDALSTVTSLGMDRESLNDASQFGFSYGLADGRVGVAVANNVPEPTSALLLVLGASALAARRRNRQT